MTMNDGRTSGHDDDPTRVDRPQTVDASAGGDPHGDPTTEYSTPADGSQTHNPQTYGSPSYGSVAPGHPASATDVPATQANGQHAHTAGPYAGQGTPPWPTPAPSSPRKRKKALAITGIALGALVLLGGAFGGGVAVGTSINQPAFDQLSVQLPGGGPGGNGELPQLPGQDGGGAPGGGGSTDGSTGDSGTTDGSSS